MDPSNYVHSLSLVEQKIVLALFLRRFSPREVLKREIEWKERVTAIPIEGVDVRVDLVKET